MMESITNSQSSPVTQVKLKSYIMMPIAVAVALTLIYGLGLTGALWTGSKLSELVMPVAVLGFFWVFTVGLVSAFALLQSTQERNGIKKLFAEAPWALWQFTPEEWKAQYEEMFRREKITARAGLTNLFVGLVIGAILIVVGYFQPIEVRTFIMFVGVLVGAGIMLLGIFLLVSGMARANRNYAEAQQITNPVVLFGRDGMYHQGTGYKSLKRLLRAGILFPDTGNVFDKMTYNTWNKAYGSPNLPLLRLRLPSRSSNAGVGEGGGAILIPIPARYQQMTEQLVQRYITERRVGSF
jgi:hypothetical protein